MKGRVSGTKAEDKPGQAESQGEVGKQKGLHAAAHLVMRNASDRSWCLLC
jgi:hypothetical protein